jgi:hypothetical protein
LIFFGWNRIVYSAKKRKVSCIAHHSSLIEFQPKSRKTDIAQALKFYQEHKKKKAIVFVISDFMSKITSKRWKLHQKNTTSPAYVYDIREEKCQI